MTTDWKKGVWELPGVPIEEEYKLPPDPWGQAEAEGELKKAAGLPDEAELAETSGGIIIVLIPPIIL